MQVGATSPESTNKHPPLDGWVRAYGKKKREIGGGKGERSEGSQREIYTTSIRQGGWTREVKEKNILITYPLCRNMLRQHQKWERGIGLRRKKRILGVPKKR